MLTMEEYDALEEAQKAASWYSYRVSAVFTGNCIMIRWLIRYYAGRPSRARNNWGLTWPISVLIPANCHNNLILSGEATKGLE